MATLPANDVAERHGADVVDQILLIPTHEIVAGDRLRAIDPVWASALGQLMARDGQQTPIEVCRLPGQRHWTLVAGAHRHAGAVAKGLAYLRAVVVSSGRDERRLREVNENLWRKDLEPIERAAFMAERVAIYKRQAGPEANERHERTVRKDMLVKVTNIGLKEEAADMLDTMSNMYGWSEEVAEQLGISPSKVRRDLYLYRRLAPSLIAHLRDARHPVARNASQLRALAKLDDQAQARVVDKLLAGAKRVADALPAKKVQAAEDKRLSTFIDTYKRMSLAEKKGALEHLRALLPAGFALSIGDNADLRPLIALITDQLVDLDPDWIASNLEGEHGARLRFANGTYELKLAKVTATCTAGGVGLLRAWINAAERRLSNGAS